MPKFNQPDPRNENTQVWVDGLVPRADAKVSVLDSVVQGGDGVWEGLRVRNGRVLQLKEHIRRLRDSAHALAFVDIPDEDEVVDAVLRTFEANGMCDGVHARMTLSRGLKSTSGMDPRLNVHGSTLIILPEYKGMVYGDESRGWSQPPRGAIHLRPWIPRSTTTTCSTTYWRKLKPMWRASMMPSCWM